MANVSASESSEFSDAQDTTPISVEDDNSQQNIF